MPSQRIIDHAIKASYHSTCEHKLAAILYKGGAVLRVVCNCSKTMGYRKRYFFHGEPTRHAEMNAIHMIPRDVLAKCSLVVVRVDRNGELKSAKPCKACALSLRDAGVKKVHYSSYSGEILKLHFNELDHEYTKERYQDFQ